MHNVLFPTACCGSAPLLLAPVRFGCFYSFQLHAVVFVFGGLLSEERDGEAVPGVEVAADDGEFHFSVLGGL